MARRAGRELFLVLVLAAAACGSSDPGSGGSGGSATGMGSGSGGAPSAGTGRSGGSAAGSGGATGASSFWPTAYDPSCVPMVPSGNHNAGRECMTCHFAGGQASSFPWVFAGTVYQSNGTTAAPHVEIGVKFGNQFLSVCSGTNGNFFLLSSLAIDWSNAEVRARNASGEVAMPGRPTTGSCNSCHAGYPIIQP